MTEYSAFPFVFFFLAEYGAIVFLSTLSSILFLGGYLVPGIESNGLLSGLSLGFKASLILFLLIWIRASFPRLRYDQLMSAIWTNMLPIVIAFSILIPCIIKAFDLYSQTPFALSIVNESNILYSLLPISSLSNLPSSSKTAIKFQELKISIVTFIKI